MRLYTLGEADYPERLVQLSDPPPRIWVRGNVAQTAPSVAIVGARRASEHGKHLARRLAFELASAGVIVVSGGALGIDAAAHEGALDAEGRTWVVLPTPIDRPAPRTNRGLFDRVLAKGGAWWSERDSYGHQSAFRERNRIIAVLADATIVVEARARSGTRYTADAARKLGRSLWAMPWAMDDPRGEGARVLFGWGARVVTSTRAVLQSLGVPVRRSARANGKAGSGDELRMIANTPMTAEEIADRLGCRIEEVLARLTVLELRGLVTSSGGRFSARR